MSNRLEPARTPGGEYRAAELAAVLGRIDGRLERLERLLGPVSLLAGEAPNAIATLVDIVDEKAARLGDVEPRASALLDVLERLTRPTTLTSLRRLVDLAEQAPDALAMLTDMVDEAMANAGREGLALGEVIENAKRLGLGLLRLSTSSEVRGLIESLMREPGALRPLVEVARAFADGERAAPPRVGVFGVLRALGREDVQRALGFSLEVMAGFGRALAEQPRRLASEAEIAGMAIRSDHDD